MHALLWMVDFKHGCNILQLPLSRGEVYFPIPWIQDGFDKQNVAEVKMWYVPESGPQENLRLPPLSTWKTAQKPLWVEAGDTSQLVRAAWGSQHQLPAVWMRPSSTFQPSQSPAEPSCIRESRGSQQRKHSPPTESWESMVKIQQQWYSRQALSFLLHF